MIRGLVQKNVLFALAATNFFWGSSAWAISVRGPKLIPLLASERQQSTQRYDNSPEDVSVFGFKPQHARSFLMIGMAPELISENYYTGASYNGFFYPNQCSLGNSAFNWKQQDYPERLQAYQQRTQQMSTCLRATVTDYSQRGIQIPTQQPNCTITRLNEAKAIASGGYCFFGISANSSFEVQFSLAPECAQRQFWKQKGFSVSDFFNHVGFYIAGDTTGSSMDLEMLGNTRVRTSFEPSGTVLPLTDDFFDGKPLWPKQVSADVHFGHLNVILPPPGSQNGAVIDSSLFVSNKCAAQCANGECESPCDFTTAMGAEMQLHELRENSSPRFLGIWYAGGAAPPQWEGVIPSSYQLEYSSLQVGKRYRVSANLNYPHFYFSLLGKGLNQQLINLSSFANASLAAGRSMPTLSMLGGLRKNTATLPGIGTTPTLSSSSNLEDPFEGPLATLKKLINTVDWPPYYETLCGTPGTCQPIVAGGAQLKLGVEFELESVNENGQAKLKNLTLTRDSNLLTSYRQEQATLTGLRCGN